MEINRFDELGEGYISKVYSCKDKKTNKNYAIKIINVQKLSNEEKIAITREINFQKTLDHPHIVKLYAYFEKTDKLYIILELVKNGNVFELLKKRNLSSNEVAFFFTQVLLGIQFIHSRKNIHRDIKPENILMTQGGILKICDFGFAAPFGENIVRKTMCGTREYLAPEVANREF